ncbi:hypothetical protein BGI36_06240 [Snodgrassella communis]|nr:hypothetical protein BGI36_06240 [Snodgrassella communis]
MPCQNEISMKSAMLIIDYADYFKKEFIMKKLLNRHNTKIVAFAAITAPCFAFADNLWDPAVTALTALGAGIAAVAAVAISLKVSVTGFVFIKNLIGRAA